MVGEFPPVPRWNHVGRAALPLSLFLGEQAGMTPEQYKAYAAECLRIAQQTADHTLKGRLLEMAEAWRRLSQSATQRPK